jgi:hypothetical protein
VVIFELEKLHADLILDSQIVFGRYLERAGCCFKLGIVSWMVKSKYLELE